LNSENILIVYLDVILLKFMINVNWKNYKNRNVLKEKAFEEIKSI